MPAAGRTRREVLGGLGWAGVGAAGLPVASAIVLAGCTPGPDRPRPPDPAPSAALDPDEAVVRRGVEAERRLLAVHAAAIAADPALAAGLAPLTAEHEAHLGALSALLPTPATARPSASAPGPTASRSSAPAATAAPAPTRAAAVAALASAEDEAAAARIDDALAASPSLARLLAGIGASESTHAVLLRRLP